MKLTFLVTHILPGDPPTLTVLQNTFSGYTFSCNYISPGVYTLQSNFSAFALNNTAVFITPDVNFETPYCAAIERTSDTLLTFTSYNMAGVFQDTKFQLATIKVEIFY
jgi:hypothetical protein